MPYKEGGKNKWRGVVRLEDGRRVTKLFETKRQAKAWEEDLKRYTPPSGTGLLELAGKYLDHCENEYITDTYKLKVSIIKRLLASVGNTATVESITRGDIQDHLMAVLQAHSPHVANDHLKHIRALFRWGDATYGTPNPVGGMKPFRAEPITLRTPTEDEVSAVLNAATGETLVFLHCYFYTGAREQEINRLKWEDVDYTDNRVRLWSRKTASHNLEPRWLFLSPTLAASLRWWQTHGAGPVHVFTNPYTGKPYVARRKLLHAACNAAGVEPFSFHPMRRYVGSFLAKDGATMREIQHVLGHKSLAHTERYVRGLDVDVTGAILRLERIKDTPEDTQPPAIQ